MAARAADQAVGQVVEPGLKLLIPRRCPRCGGRGLDVHGPGLERLVIPAIFGRTAAIGRRWRRVRRAGRCRRGTRPGLRRRLWRGSVGVGVEVEQCLQDALVGGVGGEAGGLAAGGAVALRLKQV